MLVVVLLLSMVPKSLARIRTYVRVRALDTWHVSVSMLGLGLETTPRVSSHHCGNRKVLRTKQQQQHVCCEVVGLVEAFQVQSGVCEIHDMCVGGVWLNGVWSSSQRS